MVIMKTIFFSRGAPPCSCYHVPATNRPGGSNWRPRQPLQNRPMLGSVPRPLRDDPSEIPKNGWFMVAKCHSNLEDDWG